MTLFQVNFILYMISYSDEVFCITFSTLIPLFPLLGSLSYSLRVHILPDSIMVLVVLTRTVCWDPHIHVAFQISSPKATTAKKIKSEKRRWEKKRSRLAKEGRDLLILHLNGFCLFRYKKLCQWLPFGSQGRMGGEGSGMGDLEGWRLLGRERK